MYILYALLCYDWCYMKTKIKKKSIFTKASFWIISAISFEILAIIFSLSAFRFLWLGYGTLVFPILALICGIIAIDILKTKKIFSMSGVMQIIFLVGCTLFLIVFHQLEHDKFRTLNGMRIVSLLSLETISKHIKVYIEDNNSLPDANSWCNVIKPEGVTINLYKEYAFNRNLSGLSLDKLNGNEVLLIETNSGSINNFGGDEILNQELESDKFCMFSSQKITYILFVDGTIARYRKNDGAISLYKGEVIQPIVFRWHEAFGPYIKKGKTQYSPLIWQSGEISREYKGGR
jgi:hypothetical protein